MERGGDGPGECQKPGTEAEGSKTFPGPTVHGLRTNGTPEFQLTSLGVSGPPGGVLAGWLDYPAHYLDLLLDLQPGHPDRMVLVGGYWIWHGVMGAAWPICGNLMSP